MVENKPMAGEAATTLCVTNAKGGTGKTTVTINLAGALNDRGRTVLVVDLDPQGNATEGLGNAAVYEAATPTILDALHEPQTVGAEQLIVEHPEADLLPSNQTLLGATVGRDDESYGALQAVLGPVVERYDYVLIDSPPVYGYLTELGMVTAGRVLIPAVTEAPSERAIELLVDRIEALETSVDVSITEVGVIANRRQATEESALMHRWLETAFPDVPVWTVPETPTVQTAFAAGHSVFRLEGGAETEAAAAFRAIATDIDARFQAEWPDEWQPARTQLTE